MLNYKEAPYDRFFDASSFLVQTYAFRVSPYPSKAKDSDSDELLR